MKAAVKKAPGGRKAPRRSRADIPEILKSVLQDDQVPKQRPVYISKAEYIDLEHDLSERAEEFKREGVKFARGLKHSPLSLALRRAFRAKRIPVSALKGLDGLDDVFGKYGKGPKA